MTNVGNIHDVLDVVASEFQEPPQQVTKQKSSEVTDMGKVVDGRTAAVHLHLARFDWLEDLCFFGQ